MDPEDPPQPPPPEPKKEEDEPDSDEPIEKFLPTGQTVSMAFWWASGTADDQDEKKDDIKCYKRTVELPAYRFTDDTAVPPTRYFYVPAGVVSSSHFYDDFFISEQTIAAHLLVRSNLEKLSMRKQRIVATRVFDDKQAKREFGQQYRAKFWDDFAFSALKPDGTEIDIDTLMADMRNQSDPDFAKLRTWTKFIQTIRRKTSVKYDVKARFWLPKLQPGKGEYHLYFLPTRISVVPGPFLKNAITDAYQELGNEVFKIAMTHPNEIKEKKLRRIGHNFFGLFDTYMSGPDYWRMVIASYTNKDGKHTFFPNPDPNVAVDPWPLRPWPAKTTKGGLAADKKLNHCDRVGVRQKDLELSKMMGVTTKRTRSQAQVMGYASATEIASIVWPKILVTPQQVRLTPAWNCEWLHRIAHSYAGEQHQGNLIFGTSECNTDMIRTEILVRRFVMNARPGWKCKIRTVLENELPADQERWCEDFIKDQRPMPIPPDRYSWASPFIKYTFIVEIPNVPLKDQPPPWTIWFDTMNRYMPLRLDVDVDDIIMDKFMEWMLNKYPA